MATIAISIHSLVKRETLCLQRLSNHDTISIHSLVKRETSGKDVYQWGIYNFNPLPRKEGDAESIQTDPRPDKISIHSLVKRETLYKVIIFHSQKISIHSLVKRETVWCGLIPCIRRYFNPLPRKEGDRKYS